MKKYLFDSYLPPFNLNSYLQLMASKFPEFSRIFWFDRPETLQIINEMNSRGLTDFEGKGKGGRGDSYRRAQKNTSVRIVGIKKILQLAAQNRDIQQLPSDYKILDVLGGDGTQAKAVSLIIGKKRTKQLILTSDIAADMVSQALKDGWPAIRQPAQHLLIKDNSFNAVVIAYGTHHIPKKERLMVCKEAYRVLKSEGEIVIHDFEENSPQSLWFDNVVGKYSTTGHKCSHFTANEPYSYFRRCGFKNIKILHIYDPFIVSDTSEHRAYEKLMNYVLDMYGLDKLKNGQNIKEAQRKVYHLIKKYIRYDHSNLEEAKPYWKNSVSFFKKNGKFVAEMPRVALVGVGTK